MSIACPECGAKHENDVLTCDCGCDLQQYKKEQEKQKKRAKSWLKTIRSQPYPFLFIISRLSLVYIVLTGIGAVLGLVAGIVGGDAESFSFALCGFPLLLLAVLGFVELIQLLFDIRDQQDRILKEISRSRHEQ